MLEIQVAGLKIIRKGWSTGTHMVEGNRTFNTCLNDSHVPDLAKVILVSFLFTHSLSTYHTTIMCLVPGTVLGPGDTAMNKAKYLL